jgi:hypothetical protein
MEALDAADARIRNAHRALREREEDFILEASVDERLKAAMPND